MELIRNITGVILAGGKSSRMGTNKALVEISGAKLIDRTLRLFKDIFRDTILITNTPDEYFDRDVRTVTDVIPGKGPLGGIFTGLFYAGTEHVFVSACDLPFLNPSFIRFMARREEDFDIVIPRTPTGIEPLHAIYSKRCRPEIERRLLRDECKVTGFFNKVRVLEIGEDTVKSFDPGGTLFMNINTPEDLKKIR
ncbi:MAG: molybdenum cofactor guanylyltransferase [Syntrophales bacterium]|nr:molybdenum cofactor guanylyltransferase [Syntrophales bacterium]MDD5234099.1 molybdenum cofactor guanylyltransferase [Syntrophales bacterium]MDD5533353.1 molybdenum cofactor guanylyltransferase [Syntrophales bacterium]